MDSTFQMEWSVEKQVKCGGPRASILWSFLLNICLDEIASIDNKAKFIIHVDDTRLSFVGNLNTNLVTRANGDLNGCDLRQRKPLKVTILKLRRYCFVFNWFVQCKIQLGEQRNTCRQRRLSTNGLLRTIQTRMCALPRLCSFPEPFAMRQYLYWTKWKVCQCEITRVPVKIRKIWPIIKPGSTFHEASGQAAVQ